MDYLDVDGKNPVALVIILLAVVAGTSGCGTEKEVEVINAEDIGLTSNNLPATSYSKDDFLVQKAKDQKAYNERKDQCENGSIGDLSVSEIVDLKSEFYRRAEEGGIEAVKEFIDEYYTEDVWNYLNAIGMRESSGNYSTISNSGNYLGKYQIGSKAFVDIGWLAKDDYSTWTENAALFGVSSKSDFLNNSIAQEVAMALYLRYQYMYLDKIKAIDGMIGTTIQGYVRVEKNGTYEKEIQSLEVTLSGLMAASHLVGMIDVGDEYASGGDWLSRADGNKTYATEYMYDFANYDIKKLFGYVRNKEEVGIE